jgi:hypothetical protein
LRFIAADDIPTPSTDFSRRCFTRQLYTFGDAGGGGYTGLSSGFRSDVSVGVSQFTVCANTVTLQAVPHCKWTQGLRRAQRAILQGWFFLVRNYSAATVVTADVSSCSTVNTPPPPPHPLHRLAITTLHMLMLLKIYQPGWPPPARVRPSRCIMLYSSPPRPHTPRCPRSTTTRTLGRGCLPQIEVTQQGSVLYTQMLQAIPLTMPRLWPAPPSRSNTNTHAFAPGYLSTDSAQRARRGLATLPLSARNIAKGSVPYFAYRPCPCAHSPH